MANVPLQINSELPNGAVVLGANVDTIIAENHKGEFVTWKYTWIDGEVSCYWGHYFDDADEATEDFVKRIKEH